MGFWIAQAGAAGAGGAYQYPVVGQQRPARWGHEGGEPLQ
jgi:hypothetical protein